MKWRYQPVFGTDGKFPWMSLCEVYFDEEDRLEAWTENPSMHPLGDGIADLQGDLAHMLADAYKWVPVEFSELKIGMTFERTGADVDTMLAAMNAARKQ